MRWKKYGDPLGQSPRFRANKEADRFWAGVTASGALNVATPLQVLDDDRFGSWLSGLIDGEGCFLIQSGNGEGYSARFNLLLRADDIGVLAAARARTELGRLYYSKRDPKMKNAQPAVVWAVFSREDCAALVAFIERYPLLTKKARDFAIWREAVALLQSVPAGTRGRDWSPVGALKAKLQAVRSYVPPTGALF